MRHLLATSAKLLGGLAALALPVTALEVDVTKIPADPRWEVSTGTTLTVVEIKGRTALRVGQPVTEKGVVPQSLLFLRGVTFANGEIEFEALGSAQVVQQSFLGLAFRLDPATGRYDTVYLRPFNFRATDPVRRAHGVQYTSEPDWGWKRLRTERTGVFEQAVPAALDGDEWVHVRIVVQRPAVKVYLGHATEPSLVVTELSDRADGLIGLWAVGSQPAYFANLRITSAP